MTPLLSLKKITAGYGEISILKDVSMDLFSGQIYALLGLSLIHISEPTRPY